MKRHWPPLANPFSSQPTAWVDDHVAALRCGAVNAYLVRGEDGLIAFDAGLNQGMMAKALAELGVDGADVTAVFLTHGDSDHTGGLGAYPNATVYLGALEEPLVAQEQRRFLIGYEPRLEHAHELLVDGQVVRVAGCEVGAIATPGHTPGSTSYLVDGRYLFVGDTAALRAGHLAPFARLANMDQATQIQSIQALAAKEGIAMLCTGHSGVSQEWERIAAPWRQG